MAKGCKLKEKTAICRQTHSTPPAKILRRLDRWRQGRVQKVSFKVQREVQWEVTDLSNFRAKFAATRCQHIFFGFEQWYLKKKQCMQRSDSGNKSHTPGRTRNRSETKPGWTQNRRRESTRKILHWKGNRKFDPFFEKNVNPYFPIFASSSLSLQFEFFPSQNVLGSTFFSRSLSG